MIIRVFDTVIAPDDIERAQRLFREQVGPAFERLDGCLGIEMLLGIDEHSRDLVDMVALSEWESMEAIERASQTAEYARGLTELRQLFRQAPIVRHFRKLVP